MPSESKINLQQMLSLIDLTSLNDADTSETITLLCQKAVTPHGHVAAICVYPQFVGQVSAFLKNKPVKTATVANFPSATDTVDEVVRSIRQSIADGAEEIDVVFPWPLWLRGEKEPAYDFIRICKAACGENILLKVILETGALPDSAIAEMSHHVCHAGADFLKTSTGKISVGATLTAARVMLETIRKMPRSIGFKVSGGVRTVAQASHYMELAEEIMGRDWVTPKHFRIGASQLVDAIITT